MPQARPSRRFWLEWLGAYVFSAGLCALFTFQSRWLTEEDGYYHIKMAWELRHHGFLRHGFPWAQFSLWRDGFSDGSPLFHLLLAPFTFGDLILGAKLATVLLSAFLFSSFFAILTLNGLRARLYWFWLLLLGGGFFWWRMLDTRPQILSAALLLWSVHFLLNGRRRAFAAVSFVYPLSYVAAFLPQVFSAVRWLYLKLVEGRDERRLVLWGFGAFALAMLVHPYFPKNLTFFYVQNLYVMYLAMTQKVNLYLAGEFMPLDTRQLLGAHLPLIAHLVALAFVFMHRRTPLSEKTRVLFPIALVVGALTCGSKRFVEYSVPVWTLFAAFLFTDVFAGYGERELARDWGPAGRAAFLVLLLGMGAATGVEASFVRNDIRRLPPPRFKELAATLAEKAPAGETVFTCDWDESPELFFYNEQHRFPVIMDPTFMYYWNPEIWKRWSDLANARFTAAETAREIQDTFHARFGLCGSKFQPFRELIGSDKRFRILAENDHGFVFEVKGGQALGY